MQVTEITGATAIVTGASRGFGRGIAAALGNTGAHVIGVARDRVALENVRAELGESFTPVAADAADPNVAGHLIDAYRPVILILNAGATPLPRPIHRHTWQTFSSNWQTDVQHVFHWTREALLAPLAPGSVVIAMSSGAALRGSPLSGGYAGAKATVRFIAAYAGEESDRDGLGIRFVSLFPQLTPATKLGARYVAAYAARQGQGQGQGQGRGQGQAGPAAADEPALTPEQAGASIVDLVTGIDPGQKAYVLSATGLAPLLFGLDPAE
jgi:NADP-dependent 3-hydroxy acid dehydrogenase YdfG